MKVDGQIVTKKISTPVTPTPVTKVIEDYFDLKSILTHRGPRTTEGHIVTSIRMDNNNYLTVDDDKIEDMGSPSCGYIYLLEKISSSDERTSTG